MFHASYYFSCSKWSSDHSPLAGLWLSAWCGLCALNFLFLQEIIRQNWVPNLQRWKGGRSRLGLIFLKSCPGHGEPFMITSLLQNYPPLLCPSSSWWSAALYIPCKDSRTIQRSLQGCSWHYAVVIIWNNFLSTCLFFFLCFCMRKHPRLGLTNS